jgi:deoxyhypusine synthase
VVIRNKFAPFFTPKDGGRHAEVPGEATLVRPLPVEALEQRLAQKGEQGIEQ